MTALRFGPSALNWIKTLYNDAHGVKRRLYINGKFSKPYHISLGVAQGCPLSPLLFLMVVEGLTRIVYNDKALKGIAIGEFVYKLSHFADDSFAFLKNPRMERRLNTHLGTFFQATNMRENKSKRVRLGLRQPGPSGPGHSRG